MTRTDIEQKARDYLRAARILLRQEHASYDAAHYLCGYAIELALKARICRTLIWLEYPPGGGDRFRSFRTHDLETLLTFSGIEARIKPALAAEWSIVADWNPEQRYRPLGTVKQADAEDMIEATKKILKVLI